jgi:drug/metabolite transporter (DMT)-like permease
VLTTVQAATGALLLSTVAAPQLGPAVATLPLTAWARLVYLALACTVFAFLAQTWAIRRTSPSRASLLMGTEPIWAVAVGVSFGGETLTAVAASGAVLILVATYYGQHIERSHRLARRPPPLKITNPARG